MLPAEQSLGRYTVSEQEMALILSTDGNRGISAQLGWSKQDKIEEETVY